MPGAFSNPAVLAKAQATRLRNKLAKQNGHKKPEPVAEDPHDHRPWDKMSIPQIEKRLTDIYKDYQEGIRVMRQKQASKDESTTMTPCICGCGQYIDLVRGRFASMETIRDPLTLIAKNIYWATQNCVMRYRMRNSPEYKAQQEQEKKRANV